jgi:hypothetical protein
VTVSIHHRLFFYSLLYSALLCCVPGNKASWVQLALVWKKTNKRAALITLSSFQTPRLCEITYRFHGFSSIFFLSLFFLFIYLSIGMGHLHRPTHEELHDELHRTRHVIICRAAAATAENMESEQQPGPMVNFLLIFWSFWLLLLNQYIRGE